MHTYIYADFKARSAKQSFHPRKIKTFEGAGAAVYSLGASLPQGAGSNQKGPS